MQSPSAQDNRALRLKPNRSARGPLRSGRDRLPRRAASERAPTFAVLLRRIIALALVVIAVAGAGAPAAAAPQRDKGTPATEKTATPFAIENAKAVIDAYIGGDGDLAARPTATAEADASVRTKGRQSGQGDRITPRQSVTPIAEPIGVPAAIERPEPTPTEAAAPDVSDARSQADAREEEDGALPPDTAARTVPVARTPPVAREARAAIEVTPEPTPRRTETAAPRPPAGRPAGAWPPRLDEPIMRWLPEIYAASTATGVPPRILAGIMRLESSGDPNAVSVSGARGLMQIMPYHLENQGIPRARWHDPATNILAGATLLASFESKDWRTNVGRYFGAGCDAYGTCTDVYITVVFKWIDHYAPIVRHPYRSGLPVLPPTWQPPRINPEVDDYPAVQAPRDTRYMPVGTTPIPSAPSNPRQNPRPTAAPARPEAEAPTPVATEPPAPTPDVADPPAVIDPPPPAETATAAPPAVAPPDETPTAAPPAAPTAESTPEPTPEPTAEPSSDESPSEPEVESDDEQTPRGKLLEEMDELRTPEAT